MFVSTLFKYNYNATGYVVVNQGGTSSGKTYAIQQVLFCLACRDEKQIITIVGQDIPNLKAGALRDALNIVGNSPVLDGLIKGFNRSERVFEFYNGSLMEFKSYDDGVVNLMLQGSCSGCPSYMITLKAGIEGMMKRMIPEVKEVVAEAE